MEEKSIMKGSHLAPQRYKITITDEGPYLVYGNPPLAQQFIMVDDEGASWYYQQGLTFETEAEPTALCRCGASRSKPYCDGEHVKTSWNPALTASRENMLEGADAIQGEQLMLFDNQKYCGYARFCDRAKGVWHMTRHPENQSDTEEAKHEAALCPGGRLLTCDTDTGRPFEFNFKPSLVLLEDPYISSSGGLWVRGGILIEQQDGRQYEVRNRTLLCRCGGSHNKPYCDGTHAAIKWQDNLEYAPMEEYMSE